MSNKIYGTIEQVPRNAMVPGLQLSSYKPVNNNVVTKDRRTLPMPGALDLEHEGVLAGR